MIRPARSIAAFALLSTAAPAAAYVRETTVPGHPETGLCLWWRSRQVTYRVNASSASRTPCQTTATAQATVDLGMAAWGGATRTNEASTCTDFSFVPGAPTDVKAVGRDGVNLVVFRTKRCSDVVGLDPCTQSGDPGACAAKFNCWRDDYGIGTLGLTTTSFDSETGEIFDADMELFAWDGNTTVPLGADFTCADPAAPACSAPRGGTNCNGTDVGAVVAHEAGHMLGLDHVCSSLFPAPLDACPAGAPVMAPTVGNVARRQLSQDDVSGVCTVYPKGGTTLTCTAGGTPPAEKSGGGGCSTAGGAGLAALLGAFAAAWRRRRGR